MCKSKDSNRFVICLAFCLAAFRASAQLLNVQTVCKLPQSLNETSGLLTLNSGKTFWTHNDGGDGPRLYEIDSQCQIIRTVELQSALNIDWEDITHDYHNTIYIGDFGNNGNTRKDLKIYVLANVDSLLSAEMAIDTISFSFKNQTQFPPPAGQLHFDIEAFAWYNDTLHLFSKNRTNPFNGICYHYKIPATKGSYDILPYDSIQLGTANMLLNWVCGASIAPDFKTLCLLGYDKIWAFRNFHSSDFFRGSLTTYNLPFSQKEGLAFTDNRTLALTDEFNPTLFFGGNLYITSLPITNSTSPDLNKKLPKKQIFLGADLSQLPDMIEYPAQLFSINGKFIKTIYGKLYQSHLSDIAAGLYILRDRLHQNFQLLIR